MEVTRLTVPEVRKARLRLLGPLSLEAPDGTDVTPKGKRAKALIALLALAPNGVRSRRWLQDKLWSDRPQEQGSASLRQEVSALRRLFREAGVDILSIDREVLRLDLAAVARDIDDPSAPTWGQDLLEGLDIRDSEFEDWLRTERMRFDAAPAPAPAPAAAAAPQPSAPARAVAPAGKPYLVVKGFQPIGDSERARVFAEGLTDELMTVLGSLTGAFVVRTRTPEPEAGSSYELSGHVRNGDRLRITAQLVSLDSEQCIWSGRFDYQNEASFDAQEEIARKVVEAAQLELSDGEWARIWSEAHTSINAWEAYQRGRALEAETRRESHRRAIQHYREAIAADPGFAAAMISLGFCILDELRLGWSADPEAGLAEAARLAAEVRRIDPGGYFGLALAAYVECAGGNPATACEMMADIVRSAPESPELLAYYATLLGYCGREDEALRYNRHALSLTRHPPSWILTNLAFCCLMADDPDAAAAVDATLAADPESVRAHLCRVVVAVRAGEMQDARSWAARLLTLEPGFRADRWCARECYGNPPGFLRIADDLRAAGL
jgi:TolB-like protein